MSHMRNAIERIGQLRNEGKGYVEIEEQLRNEGFKNQNGDNYTLQTVRSYGSNSRKYLAQAAGATKRKYTKRAKPGRKPGVILRKASQMQTFIEPETTTRPMMAVIGNKESVTEFVKNIWG